MKDIVALFDEPNDDVNDALTLNELLAESALKQKERENELKEH